MEQILSMSNLGKKDRGSSIVLPVQLIMIEAEILIRLGYLLSRGALDFMGIVNLLNETSLLECPRFRGIGVSSGGQSF